MNNVKQLTDQTFQQEVLASDKPVLVDFYADWCAPCRVVAPIIEEIADEMEGDITVASLDIDSERELTETYHVQSIPTVILFKDGQPVERWRGVQPKEEYLAGATKHVAAHA